MQGGLQEVENRQEALQILREHNYLAQKSYKPHANAKEKMYPITLFVCYERNLEILQELHLLFPEALNGEAAYRVQASSSFGWKLPVMPLDILKFAISKNPSCVLEMTNYYGSYLLDCLFVTPASQLTEEQRAERKEKADFLVQTMIDNGIEEFIINDEEQAPPFIGKGYAKAVAPLLSHINKFHLLRSSGIAMSAWWTLASAASKSNSINEFHLTVPSAFVDSHSVEILRRLEHCLVWGPIQQLCFKEGRFDIPPSDKARISIRVLEVASQLFSRITPSPTKANIPDRVTFDGLTLKDDSHLEMFLFQTATETSQVGIIPVVAIKDYRIHWRTEFTDEYQSLEPANGPLFREGCGCIVKSLEVVDWDGDAEMDGSEHFESLLCRFLEGAKGDSTLTFRFSSHMVDFRDSPPKPLKWIHEELGAALVDDRDMPPSKFVETLVHRQDMRRRVNTVFHYRKPQVPVTPLQERNRKQRWMDSALIETCFWSLQANPGILFGGTSNAGVGNGNGNAN